MKQILTIGHSPDPDDAFMFYGFREGSSINAPFGFQHIIENIETLNQYAVEGKLDISAISAAHYPRVSHLYRILSTGASMGRRYGPIVVAKSPMNKDNLKGHPVAIPGAMTTAALLAKIYLPPFEAMVCSFEEVFKKVKKGEATAGVIIHEGQLTYRNAGFCLVMDLGKQWYEETDLPLPLGLDVVRRDLEGTKHSQINHFLRESIQLAYENFNDAVSYAMQYGRGIPRNLCEKFIRMYVNNDTINMGDEGRKALEMLYQKAEIEVSPIDIIT